MTTSKLRRTHSMRERVEETLVAHRNEIVSLLSRYVAQGKAILQPHQRLDELENIIGDDASHQKLIDGPFGDALKIAQVCDLTHDLKPNGVATIIGKIGIFFAVITFAVLVQRRFIRKMQEGSQWIWSGDDALEMLEFDEYGGEYRVWLIFQIHDEFNVHCGCSLLGLLKVPG